MCYIRPLIIELLAAQRGMVQMSRFEIDFLS